ncbi:hypothetical protein VFPFJ_11340 [Purpureocillium lilacinum]|uniref:Uncharacterized protein n=1 Tax=Purpureocillium lilacinum TaxID=33203 RepID=A0A179FFQ7_PURLI|nr:hypothetical protein VFPFJ_11340 [Purpureocillium lilacinum]OAQ63879.1 hypothetical protein VFPFJ_11340 [Purpureocillium lilacinum]
MAPIHCKQSSLCTTRHIVSKVNISNQRHNDSCQSPVLGKWKQSWEPVFEHLLPCTLCFYLAVVDCGLATKNRMLHRARRLARVSQGSSLRLRGRCSASAPFGRWK